MVFFLSSTSPFWRGRTRSPNTFSYLFAFCRTQRLKPFIIKQFTNPPIYICTFSSLTTSPNKHKKNKRTQYFRSLVDHYLINRSYSITTLIPFSLINSQMHYGRFLHPTQYCNFFLLFIPINIFSLGSFVNFFFSIKVLHSATKTTLSVNTTSLSISFLIRP